jgi:catechol 2,3-dioxygenase-like lactoylglutathione lyase family enzyme
VTHEPNLGLLFDVDGPLASPTTRTINIPSIVTDLVALASAGVPIAFITGRSDAFIRDEVVAPLLAAGLADAFASPHVRMFGVFEKGAAWAPIGADGLAPVTVDHSVELSAASVEAVRALVASTYSDTMFFDESKLAMISVEQRVDVAHATYQAVQEQFNDETFALLAAQGIGVRLRDREEPNAAGAVPFRLDPTIISTDVESVLLDKDRGAERAIEYFAGLGNVPTRWRSVGDSRGDYLMADHLHTAGYEVAHVDVRPADGILERPYPIITEGNLIHDEAGAAFLGYWVKELGLTAP